jgi:UDP-glucose 4-epimerase
MMRSVLVTGGNGFIGRYVVRELLARGYKVAVLDTRYRETEEGAKVVLGDIRDRTSVNEAIAHADGAIHLAGVLGTQETITNPGPAAETNILGGINVFEACTQHSVPLVNIAVGNWWMNNTYSITKSTMERFAAMFNKERGAKISIVRALNAYGPGQSVAAPFGPSKVRKIMPSFSCRALTGMPIEVYGDGSQVMDMIYVEDVARVLVSALEHTEQHGPFHAPIEAGSGRATTVNEIAGMVIGSVKGRYGVDSFVKHLPMRPGEDEHSIVLGNPDTMKVLGITPDMLLPLEQGIDLAVVYFHDYLVRQGLMA